MKKIILILFIIGFNIVSCQNERKVKMIEQFIFDLFDETISPKKVVKTYLEIRPDTLNVLSLDERKKIAEGMINKTRNKKGEEATWLIPNSQIRSLKSPKVFPYKNFKHLNKLEISGIESIEENVYILLDSKKEKILQYILLNKNYDKIVSFNLFVKSENLAWFFTY